MKKLQSKESGFTIIEVVLVLAIAGLIFLVVFLALPQLQRSRRDTARRDQVGRIIASLTQAASNNSGDFPADTAEFVTFATGGNYFGACSSTTAAALQCESLSDPSTGTFAVSTPASDAAPSVIGTMFYDNSATCGANGTVDVGSGGSREVAVSVALEQGGAYCQDNSD